jgi:hypothetical protein
VKGALLCPVSRPPTERLFVTSLSRRRALRIFLRALIIAAGLSLVSTGRTSPGISGHPTAMSLPSCRLTRR